MVRLLLLTFLVFLGFLVFLRWRWFNCEVLVVGQLRILLLEQSGLYDWPERLSFLIDKRCVRGACKSINYVLSLGLKMRVKWPSWLNWLSRWLVLIVLNKLFALLVFSLIKVNHLLRFLLSWHPIFWNISIAPNANQPDFFFQMSIQNSIWGQLLPSWLGIRI